MEKSHPPGFYTSSLTSPKKQEAVAVDEAAMLTYGAVDLSGISAD